jgi:hypothetical protein
MPKQRERCLHKSFYYYKSENYWEKNYSSCFQIPSHMFIISRAEKFWIFRNLYLLLISFLYCT